MAVYKDVEELMALLPTTRLSDSREYTNGYNSGWDDLRRMLIELPAENYSTICCKIKERKNREINVAIQWMKDFCSCAEENGFTRDEAIKLLRIVYEYRRR